MGLYRDVLSPFESIFFNQNSSIKQMSVSKAILSGNFKELESAIEGKTNEVYSTILFDSYDDKRIEEMLFLEAFNWINELLPKHVYHSGAHLGYNDLVSEHKRAVGERLYQYEYDQYRRRYDEQRDVIIKTCTETIKTDLNLTGLLVYITQNHSKFIHEKHFKFGKIDFVLAESRPSNFHIYYNGDTIMSYTSNSSRPYSFYLQYTYYDSDIRYESKMGSYTLVEDNKLTCHNCSYGPETEPKPIEKSLLLKRLCERHALNEHMVSSMKKKLEIERLYYHMKDLSIEDSKLTQEINTKREQLNTLKEDICSRKIELSSIENRIINAQNELEASVQHLKSFEISNEIEYENTFLKLSTEEQHILECKTLHEYYIQNANELKIYRLAFENMREISMKLQREKEELEEWKATETKKMEEKIKAQEEEIKRREEAFQKMMKEREAKFDADCESYEIESTKWKSQMESKFSQYQSRIDNYPELKDERDRLKQELSKLKTVLAQTTKERDEFKTTIETLMAFRK